MNAVTFVNQYGTSVTVEADVEEIWDWEFIFAGVLTIFGYHPDTIKEFFGGDDAG